MVKNKSKTKCRKKDLVSLIWPVNTCYSTLITGVPKGVTINLVANTWTFRGEKHQIGDSGCSFGEDEGNPIGVYDRTKIKHLEQLKQDIEWVKTRHAPVEDA
jgi:hypothetical protein